MVEKMYKLLRFLKDYKKESILGPLFKLLEASFELLVPLVVAAIIDKGIGGADRGRRRFRREGAARAVQTHSKPFLFGH